MPHEMERFQAHLPEVLGAAVAFMEPGEELDLIANFGVGRKILRLDAAPAETFGRLAFGGEVLGFDPFVHQPSGFQGNFLAKLDIGHPFMRRYEAHCDGAGL